MNDINWKKELWDKFKSPLGHSSINNKTNSMYDLESFIDKILKQQSTQDPHKDCISKEEVKALLNNWKNGNCYDCQLPTSSVPNWNCKQHAYKDLDQLLSKPTQDPHKDCVSKSEIEGLKSFIYGKASIIAPKHKGSFVAVERLAIVIVDKITTLLKKE